MKLTEELRALRGDDTPQRAAQAAMFAARDVWRSSPEVAPVLADLARFAAGSAMAECPALAALFEDEDPAAMRLADRLAWVTTRALAAAPLGHVAQRHFTDGTVSTLLLAQDGPISLSLIAVDGAGFARKPAPLSVNLSPSEQWERVLAGTAEADLILARPDGASRVRLEARQIALAPGKILARDCSRQALILRRVTGCLVSLRLQRRRHGNEPSREYELASGELVHQAAGDPRDSRHELMLALLGRMERTEAAPLMATIAREPGSDGLRWQALRECQALYTAQGFAALRAVAQSPCDPLAAPSATLCTRLVAAHPQLAEIA